MASHSTQEARDHTFAEVTQAGVASAPHLATEDLKRVRLEITADLGQSTMMVRDVLELKRGSIVQINKLAGETADVFVNRIPLAKGEIVVLGDTLAIRVVELHGAETKGEGKSGAE